MPVPALVLGPLLRHVSTTTATVWVEVDSACTVTVLDHEARTFCVHGHHYALVVIEGLEPGSCTPYRVELDGASAWPIVGSPFPDSTIRTLDGDGPLRVLFGSCRATAPHHPPHDLEPGRDPVNAASTPSAPTACGCSASQRVNGRTSSSVSAIRSTPTTRRRKHSAE